MPRRRKPGPSSMAKQTGEPTIMFSMMLRKSQHDYLLSQEVPAAQFVRYLINISMIYRDLSEGRPPNTYDLPQEFIVSLAELNIPMAAMLKNMNDVIVIPEEEEE